MFNQNFAVYLGKEKTEGFSGFIAENNFFAILIVNEVFTKDEGKNLLKKISQLLLEDKIESLTIFETKVSELISKSNLPLEFSFACGYLKDELFYLKTVGDGEIFIKRGKDFLKLISGDNIASGYIKQDDFFLFSNKYFNQILGAEIEIKKILDHKKPNEIVEEITPKIKEKDDQGAMSLLLLFEKNDDIRLTEEEDFYQKEILSTGYNNKTGNLLDSLKSKFIKVNNIYGSNNKKKFTFIMLIIILIIFCWSVIFGYKRRTEANIQKKISQTKEVITQKLNQADEVAFLNLSRSLTLVAEAKKDLVNLKKEVDKKHQNDIKDIEKLINDKESKLLKKEDKNYEEFFDLAVEEKNARGEKTYLSEDNLAILNSEDGIIYVLSISKKSLISKKFTEIKSSTLVGIYDEQLFFYNPKDGVFKIDEKGKLKKIIEKDEDWGEIIDLIVYNGNIYLLDKLKDEVYKYLVAVDGYSSKSSYFKQGEAIDLNNTKSFAIDSSVYICLNDKIIKYTSGVKDEFKTSFPDEKINLKKIFTNKESEKVYAWDKDKGTFYILNKNGTYERQIKSGILTKADDLVVYGNAAFILADQKIFKIDLK